MISNVAPPSTDAAGSSPQSAGDTADTGAFDALLALQSLIDADAATGVTTQLASTLEGVDLLGTQEDAADDSVDDATETPDDALWFLATPLPVLKVPPPAATASAAGSPVPVHNDLPQAGAGTAASAASTAAQIAATANDLAQAFGFAVPDTGADPKSILPDTKTATTTDPTTWNSLSGPAELFAHTSRSGTPGRVESAPLTTHVRDPRWVDDLGNRLASMVRTGESSASLQLTPVDLGPLEVNVAVRDNQATVHFGAANAETRALLEASIPRLREMLAAQGFQLMDSSVSHGFARQTRHESAGTPRIDGIGEAPITVKAIHITGLLDLYA